MSASDAPVFRLIPPAEAMRRARAAPTGICMEEMLAFMPVFEDAAAHMVVRKGNFRINRRKMPKTPACFEACLEAARAEGYTVERDYKCTPEIHWECDEWVFGMPPPPRQSLWERLFG